MRRPFVILLLSAILAGLHTLVAPATPAQLTFAALMGVASAPVFMLPALLAPKRDRALYATLLGFGDAACTLLALLLLLNIAPTGIGMVCATHVLAMHLLGGRLLRRAGFAAEKNFLLILAYRQTIAHHAKFPQEVHPRKNPLFEPARNGLRALTGLLPLGAVLSGVLLQAMGFRPDGSSAAILMLSLRVLSALLLLHTLVQLPRLLIPVQKPDVRLLPMVLLRAVMILPPDPALFDELQRGGADDATLDSARCTLQWCWLFTMVMAAILLLHK